MTIEKPIRTIRKAVYGAAEELAAKELKEKPEEKHYAKVFLIFKLLRNINPETLEKVIIASAKGKELKDKLGKELMAEFQRVSFEISTDFKEKTSKAIQQIEEDSSIKNKHEGIEAIGKIVFEEMGVAIRNDSRLLNSFAGKEELLDEAINFLKTDFPKLLVASN